MLIKYGKIHGLFTEIDSKYLTEFDSPLDFCQYVAKKPDVDFIEVNKTCIWYQLMDKPQSSDDIIKKAFFKYQKNWKVLKDDITEVKCDVIVNAANEFLSDGSGVNGAIQKKAGPGLINFCNKLYDGCKIGKAVLTPAFKLNNTKAIIHAVGPVYHKYTPDTAEELLEQCYFECLKLADESGYETIAFSALSCGIYGYPISEATNIAVETVETYLAYHNSNIKKVIFVAFTDEIYYEYKKYQKVKE